MFRKPITPKEVVSGTVRSRKPANDKEVKPKKNFDPAYRTFLKLVC
jgi:hypothetical protein